MLLDAAKLDHDTYKHLTTLSTASLVLLVGFIEKLFSNPEWVTFAIVAIVFFFISILASVASMFYLSYSLYLHEALENAEKNNAKIPSEFIPKRTWIPVSLSVGGFILGIIFIAAFGIANFLFL